MDEKIKELEASILDEENLNIEENVLNEKKLDEEQLEEDKLDEEELEETAGGKKKADNLLYNSVKKPDLSKTLYSGESKNAGNLLYNEEDEGTMIDGIRFNSEPKLC